MGTAAVPILSRHFFTSGFRLYFTWIGNSFGEHQSLIVYEGYTEWIVPTTSRTWQNATARTALVREWENAVNAYTITVQWDSFPPAIFQLPLKKPTTGQ